MRMTSAGQVPSELIQAAIVFIVLEQARAI
jgi:hypothetical protein